MRAAATRMLEFASTIQFSVIQGHPADFVSFSLFLRADWCVCVCVCVCVCMCVCVCAGGVVISVCHGGSRMRSTETALQPHACFLFVD